MLDIFGRNDASVAGTLFAASVLFGGAACCVAANKNRRNIKEYRQSNQLKSSGFHSFLDESDCYDVLIVGAGPAGATAANFLGEMGVKTALLDKKVFPRAKPCGDAWCQPALAILEELGILSDMEADGITHPVKRGGFISPFGYECINTDGASYGSVTGCKTYAIKRRIADEYIVKAAKAFDSVTVMEGVEVTNATFHAQRRADGTTCSDDDLPSGAGAEAGIWKVDVKVTQEASDFVKAFLPAASGASAGAGAGEGVGEGSSSLRARIVLICDGSLSYLAQKLGVLKSGTQSAATCSHAYVKGGTHNWTSADGVMMFNKATLPGYSALFKHYNGDMYLGTYILPGGRATSRAIAPFETEAVAQHPYIRAAFGDKYSWEEKRVVAPIRCGGIEKPYKQQLLVVGDAAGHVDPLTGEGIHTAMVAGKIAAHTTAEMIAKNNFTLDACRAYDLRCYDAFGYEFWSSSLAAALIVAMPIALDAITVVGQRRGQPFLDFFGEVMTGVRPKSDFLLADPLLLVEVGVELVRQCVLQGLLGAKPLIPQDIGTALVEEQYRKSLNTGAKK